MTGHFKLGQMLLAQGLVDPERLESALAEQARSGGRLGAVLIRLGALAEEDLVRALAAQLRVPVARIRGKRVHPDVLARVPLELAEKYRCLPLLLRDEPGGRVLTLALEDPSDREALEELSFQLGERLRPVLIGPAQLDDALRRHYREEEARPHAEPPAEPPRAGTAEGSGDPDTAPELPPADPLLHPAAGPTPEPAAAGDDPDQDTQPHVEASGAPSRPAADLGDPQLVLRALAQLLVEKGVLGREELLERLRRLAPGETPA
jgi:type IV pilus assembly protein PilB